MELFVYQNNTSMVCILLFLLQTVVVKTTVYLTDLKDYAAVNSAYSEGKVGIIVWLVLVTSNGLIVNQSLRLTQPV